MRGSISHVVRGQASPPGSYSARWASWVVGLRHRENGWEAKVWRWHPGKPLAARFEKAVQGGFADAVAAVQWACDAMRKDGAIVMVLDAPRFTLADALDFVPAPEAVD